MKDSVVCWAGLSRPSIHPPADEDIQLIGFASMQVKRKFLAETVNLPETKSSNVILRAHNSTLEWHAFFFIILIRPDGGRDRLGANTHPQIKYIPTHSPRSAILCVGGIHVGRLIYSWMCINLRKLADAL